MIPTWRHACARPGRHPPGRRLGDSIFNSILLVASSASLALMAVPFIVLFWLMQPATRANPGVSAYEPPPATRLAPVARSVAFSEQPREFSSATNFAREYPRTESAAGTQLHTQLQETQVSTQREARLTHRKESRVGYRRKYQQPARAYAQERNDDWQPRYR